VTTEFFIFGPPRVIRQGKRVRLHSAKTLALLAYLVCHPETIHSRDILASLLWGGSPEAKARQSLRQALYSLRRALGDVVDSCLMVQAQTVEFIPDPGFQVDYLEFNRHLEAGEMESAIDFYRGTMLEGVTIDDCPAFEEWLFLARDRVVQQMIRALQEVVDRYMAMGQAAEAVRQGERLIALDILNEGAYRRLMRAYAAQGELDGVRRYYRLCADRFLNELGVEPAAETTELYQQLLSSTAVISPSHPTPDIKPMISFPYQGCEAELAQLREHFTQALHGQTSLVFVRGETGSGKSELVYEFWRREEEQRPLPLIIGRAREAETGAPYTIWSEALSVLNTPQWHSRLDGLPAVWRIQLDRLVPGISTRLPMEINTSTEENHLRFMQGIVQCLIHLSRDGPLLIMFDDLHWSDIGSLELLHFAARHCVTHPILFVGAYSTDVIENKAQMLPYINHHLYATIGLSPMDLTDIETLLVRSGIRQPGAAALLHKHCHGNRLMLIETLRHLQESGNLDRQLASESLPIPPRIQDLVETRLARLNDQSRRVLAAAAVIGRPFDVTLLHHVSGQQELDLLEDVETLMARGFLEEIEEVGTEQISFHHGYARSIAYGRLRQSQCRALHRRTADALLAIHQSHPERVVEEVAFHLEQAGEPRALVYLRWAAEQAESFYAFDSATKLLSRALVFQERTLPEAMDGRFEILLDRERLLAQRGQRAAQAEDIDALISLSEKLAKPQRQAQAWIRRAGYLNDAHQSQESRQAAEKALSLYRQVQDRHGEAQALRELGFLYWSTNAYSLALEYGRQALRLHRLLGDIDGEATALHNLAEIHRGLNSPRQAIGLYEQALQLYWARQDHQRQCLSLYGMAHALRQLGNRQQALETYRQALTQTDLAGDRLLASRVYHEMSNLLLDLGELEQAVDAMEQAAAISREIGYAAGLAHSLTGLGYLFIRLQRKAEARATLHEAAEWFHLMEDQDNLQNITLGLRQLDNNPDVLEASLAQMGWVKTYVALVEGKVYCEFESPLARATFAPAE